jgi:phosphoesterase RecJ-like protein
MNVDWNGLAELLRRHEKFVLTTHVRPDADALGSQLGFAGLLRHLGKQVKIINASAVPPRLKFLDPDGECGQLGPDWSEQSVLEADCHVILDTSSWIQLAELGKLFKKTNAVRVVIDHHASADDLHALDFKDVTAEATGAMVFDLAESQGWPLTPGMARALYCAIATDTGWFRFPSTTSATMRRIARLIDCGAEPAVLYGALYEQCSLGRTRLAGRCLSRMMIDAGGRLAWTYITLIDYRETGAEPTETDDLVNEGLRLAGVEAAYILIEQPNGNVKASLRSRSHLDVSAVAEKFGGGGHRQASGAMVPGPMAEAQVKILTAMKTLFPT